MKSTNKITAKQILEFMMNDKKIYSDKLVEMKASTGLVAELCVEHYTKQIKQIDCVIEYVESIIYCIQKER